MKVPCRLRELRGDRTVRDIARSADIPLGAVSQLERGHLLPSDDWVPRLEQVYGQPITAWYTPHTLLALIPDNGKVG